MKLLLNRLTGYEGAAASLCMASAAILSVIGKFHLVDKYRHQLEHFVRIPFRLPLETPLPPVEAWAYDILLFLLVCFGFGFAASALRHGPAQNRWLAGLCVAIFWPSSDFSFNPFISRDKSDASDVSSLKFQISNVP